MSASDKKKLRKERQTELLTAKQRQEQAEAKKLKNYTIGFIALMAVVVVVAIGSLVVSQINTSGVREKNTIAASIDGVELNTVELSYYYNEAINEIYNDAYNQYSSYYELYFESMGLDIHSPLNKQVQNKETGATWADYFVDSALNSAKRDFTLEKLAKEAGYSLPEETAQTLENYFTNLEASAKLSGYSGADSYLRMMYGNGADLESFKEYLTRTELADAYYQHYYDELSYDDAAIEAHAKEQPNNYNSYNYSYSYLSYTDFQKGGTKDENGTVTYSEEENAAAREALKTAAEEMATATTLEELKQKAEAVDVNETSQVAVNEEKRALHTSLNATLSNWLAAEDRKEGDIAAIPNTSAVTGTEETIVNGYYVVYFDSRTDNKTPMSNVRHLLVSFEGGTPDETTGEMTYSDEEKATAQTEADNLLQQWKDGDATEESFIALVKEHSDDGSAADGGLFENIHPDSDYVPNFLNWSINSDRKPGDTEVIETEFGYHVMYYVDTTEMTYRDYMITQEMKTEDRQEWYDAALKDVVATKLDLSRLNLELVISPSA